MLRCVQRREIPSTPAALLKQLNSEGYLQAQKQQQRSVRESYEVTASGQLCIECWMHGAWPQLRDSTPAPCPLLLMCSSRLEAFSCSPGAQTHLLSHSMCLTSQLHFMA